MSDKTVRDFFTGGESGSPTIPMLVLAEEIRGLTDIAEFSFFGSKFGPDRKIVEEVEIRVSTIPSGTLRRYWN